MVTIISKSGGARREDAAARALLEQNRGTIRRLADQFTGGGYSAQKKAEKLRREQKEQERQAISRTLGQSRPVPREGKEPYVRISVNNRVVIADAATSRQLHFLGSLTMQQGRRVFALATAENGFDAVLDAELAGKLAGLDGREIPDEDSEAALRLDIQTALGLEPG